MFRQSKITVKQKASMLINDCSYVISQLSQPQSFQVQAQIRGSSCPVTIVPMNMSFNTRLFRQCVPVTWLHLICKIVLRVDLFVSVMSLLFEAGGHK